MLANYSLSYGCFSENLFDWFLFFGLNSSFVFALTQALVSFVTFSKFGNWIATNTLAFSIQIIIIIMEMCSRPAILIRNAFQKWHKSSCFTYIKSRKTGSLAARCVFMYYFRLKNNDDYFRLFKRSIFAVCACAWNWQTSTLLEIGNYFCNHYHESNFEQPSKMVLTTRKIFLEASHLTDASPKAPTNCFLRRIKKVIFYPSLFMFHRIYFHFVGKIFVFHRHLGGNGFYCHITQSHCHFLVNV